MQLLKQSTAATVKLGPFVDNSDGYTPETALTISQADIRLSKNGGAFAQTNNATGATHDENGWYGIPLDTTDTGTLGRLKLAVYESGALPCFAEFMVVPANVYDSLVSGSDYLQADAVQWNGSAVATPTVAGVPEVDITHISGDAQSTTDLKDFADAGYDPATNYITGIAGTKNTFDDLNDIAQSAILNDATPFSGADIADILLDTGGTLPALIAGLNDLSSSDVTTACTSSLNTYDPPSKTEMDAAFTEIKGATWAATDTLEAIRDRGDAAWITATGFSTHSAADIWSVGTRALTDKAGFSLSASGIDSIIDEVIEGSLTMRQILRLYLAALAGKSAGGGTSTLTFRDNADAKNRISATVDSNGNRTAMTLDGS